MAKGEELQSVGCDVVAEADIGQRDMMDPDPPGPRRRSCLALIDDVPLSQSSTLGYLRPRLRCGVRAFASAGQLLRATERGALEEPCAVILAAGPRPMTDPRLTGDMTSLSAALTRARLIVLADRRELADVAAAFRLGARGYVPTSMPPDLCVHAIQLVLAGGRFFPVDAVVRDHGALLEAAARASAATGAQSVGDGWPPRQMAVLRLLVRGMANKEIARTLTMEESTVKAHIHHILRKLGVRNRTQAALEARRSGMLPLEGGGDARADLVTTIVGSVGFGMPSMTQAIPEMVDAQPLLSGILQ